MNSVKHFVVMTVQNEQDVQVERQS